MNSKLHRGRISRISLIAASLALISAGAGDAENGWQNQTIAFATPDAPAAAGTHAQLLKSGLDALGEGDVSGARRIRDRLPAESLHRRLLAWAIAMDGGRDIPNGDIVAAAVSSPGWPGASTMRRNSERALYREDPPADAVIAAFETSKPQTLDGVILLLRAYTSLGRVKDAQEILSPYWRTARLDASEEARIRREFSALLTVADHRSRMEKMLYSQRVASAMRVAKAAGAEPLAKAWAAVIRNERKAGDLLKAVPSEMHSAGYRFAKARYLRRQKKYVEAAEVILGAPTDAVSLIDPDAWWLERRVLSRELVDIGEMKRAYRIAASHTAESPVEAAEAEFHAGWYAFRGLDDARTGARHFARIAEIASGSISLARAYYWMGRAAEGDAPEVARSHYEKAAGYSTTFYGQLAAERIGRRTFAIALPEPSPLQRATFEGREKVRAIRLLEQAGFPSLAELFYRALAEELNDPAEIALLAGMAESRGNQVLALRIGKIAANRGLDVSALSHPVGAIPDGADIAASGKALAYAIARQESEFNVSAVSRAGARGLLQLLPGTAKAVARKAGLTFSPEKLTTDAAYNATLGAAFLGEQLDRFDGSYVLTLAGYNAGPTRARDWIKRYGDPRGKDLDAVIDWIERIPFAETRTYVQRVMENYQVYKMRLSGTFDIKADLTKGRVPTP